MTCHYGDGIVLCTGRTGSFVGYAACPWCCLPGDPPVRVLDTPIFSGWCGSDMVCGNCGQEWSTDSEYFPENTPDQKRQWNLAAVTATHDPKCWDCHDTGFRDIRNPLDVPSERCPCGTS